MANKQKLDIPKHLVIIPDGNRRWAKKNMLKPWEGHRIASTDQHLSSLFNEARKLGIKYMSIWGFSTENWNRSEFEKKFLFEIFYESGKKLLESAHKERICVRHFGRKDRLPKKVLDILNKLEKETKNYQECFLNVCLDYGGRDEIVRAVNKILKDGKKKISEKEFVKYLDSAEIPDPDLIIRTGGEKRLSGFMPFQSAYSELYFTETLFPDFNAEELRKAVEYFSKIERRFGK